MDPKILVVIRADELVSRVIGCHPSKRLRVLRAEREWSQARLAAEVGVTRQTINSIEKRRYNPNLRLAFKIARAFGKLVEEVFIYESQ